MADLPPYSDRSQDTGTRQGMPRWVKVFGIIAVILVLLFVISMLAGVRHGPGLHTPSSRVIQDDTMRGAGLGGYAPAGGGHG